MKTTKTWLLAAALVMVGGASLAATPTTPTDPNGLPFSSTNPFAIGPAAGTPVALLASTVGGAAVTAVTGPANGCFIVNPATATEVLYVNGVTTATTTPSATTVALQAGQSWSCVPGQTTNVSVNAATPGHVFSGQKW